MSDYIKSGMKRYNFLMAEIDNAYHEAALKLGLSDSAMMILYAICSCGESCLLSEIIHWLGISKQTVNSSLRKLEQQDIIYLESAGGKTKRVCLTENGRAKVNDTVCRIIEIENKIFASWDREEWDIYLELTNRYLNAFKKEIKEL